MDIKRETITLTPAMAEALLNTNYEKQRKLNIGYATSLARDIQAGRWVDGMVNQAIIISDTGKLLDGQHRCKAVILADKPIITELCTNVPESFFYLMDCNKPRTTAQFIDMKKATIVLSLARYANAIESGSHITSATNGIVERVGGTSCQATRIELMNYINLHKTCLMFFAEMTEKVYRSLHGGSKAGYGEALWTIGYINGFANLDKIGEFVDELSKDLPAYEAIAQGKNRISKLIIDTKSKHISAKPVVYLAQILAMYDGFTLNKPIAGYKILDKKLNAYDKVVDAVRDSKARRIK